MKKKNNIKLYIVLLSAIILFIFLFSMIPSDPASERWVKLPFF